LLNEIKKRRKGRNPADLDERKIKVVIFSLSNGFFSFYGEEVKEILPLGNIFYVPGAPENILGVINVRGDIESVISIHRVLGLPDPEKSRKSRIVIAEAEGIRSGILLDSIEDVLDISVNSIRPALSTLDDSLKDFISGETFYNGCNISILHVGAIFRKACA
jgi:purine-binding chemotaxis protein CheW